MSALLLKPAPRSTPAVETPRPRAKRIRREEHRAAAPALTVRLLLSICAVAGVFAALGLWQVHTVFSMRDLDMETRRLQVAAARRGEQTRELQAQLSWLQSDESLRNAATTVYGMSDPAPESVTMVEVPREVRERWATGAAQARERLRILQSEQPTSNQEVKP